MPNSQSPLTTMPNSSREDILPPNRQPNRLVLVFLTPNQGHGKRRFQHDRLRIRRGRGVVALEQEQGAEHVFVRLVVACAEDEFGVGVEVENAFDDFALVDGDGTDFEVLLADEDLDGSFTREVVLEEVLALVTLEETARRE